MLNMLTAEIKTLLLLLLLLLHTHAHTNTYTQTNTHAYTQLNETVSFGSSLCAV